jgi:hypothetical protein
VHSYKDVNNHQACFWFKPSDYLQACNENLWTMEGLYEKQPTPEQKSCWVKLEDKFDMLDRVMFCKEVDVDGFECYGWRA